MTRCSGSGYDNNYIITGQDEMHRDNFGVDCLHFSSLEGHPEVTRMLLEYGADIDSQDDQGRTSLLMACQQGKIDCVNVLLDNGANVNLPAHNGNILFIISQNQNISHLSYI